MIRVFIMTSLMVALWIIGLYKKPINWVSVVLDMVCALIFIFAIEFTMDESQDYWRGRSGDSFEKFIGNFYWLILPGYLLKMVSLGSQKALPSNDSAALLRFR
jgi:ABC-type uncharacterized transport system permease subunit